MIEINKNFPLPLLTCSQYVTGTFYAKTFNILAMKKWFHIELSKPNIFFFGQASKFILRNIFYLVILTAESCNINNNRHVCLVLYIFKNSRILRYLSPKEIDKITYKSKTHTTIRSVKKCQENFHKVPAFCKDCGIWNFPIYFHDISLSPKAVVLLDNWCPVIILLRNC